MLLDDQWRISKLPTGNKLNYGKKVNSKDHFTFSAKGVKTIFTGLGQGTCSITKQQRLE